MKQLQKNPCFAALLPAVAIALLAGLAGQLLPRHLSLFLSFDPQFAAIFSQLRQGKMVSDFVVLGLLAYLLSLLMTLLRRKLGRLLPAALAVVCFPLLCLLSALTTRVNGVLFWDIVVSLLDVLEKGGLEGL